MKLLKSNHLNRGSLSPVFKRVYPTAISIIPVGLLFGILAAKAHWQAIDVLFISAFGFTGSGQFALLPLSTQGAGFLTMLLVAISINCRYIPIAFTTSSRLPENKYHRLYLGHLLGDEAYAIEKSSDSHTSIIIIRTTIFIAWVLSNITGLYVAQFIPQQLINPSLNLGIAASLALLYLSFNQLKNHLLSSKQKRLLIGLVVCIALATIIINLLGTVYFWLPSIIISTWILWKIKP